VTVTTVPLTVSRAVRGELDGLAVAEKVTVPLPDPLVTEGVSHEALLSTRQVHVPLAFVTAIDTLDELAMAPSATLAGATVYEQVALANTNGFEGVLRRRPPWPTAATRAS
jgi:hypothetical protein